MSIRDGHFAEICLCGPQYNNGTNPSCPEHGTRCRNVDCDKLCDTVEAYSVPINGVVQHFCRPYCASIARLHAGPTAEQVREAYALGATADCADGVCSRCRLRLTRPESALCSICFAQVKHEAITKPDPACSCGASLRTTRAWRGSRWGGYGSQQCVDCVLFNSGTSSTGPLTRPAFAADVSRPVVSLAELEHPKSWFSGRNPGRRKL
jgi:hypothetical protein